MKCVHKRYFRVHTSRLSKDSLKYKFKVSFKSVTLTQIRGRSVSLKSALKDAFKCALLGFNECTPQNSLSRLPQDT